MLLIAYHSDGNRPRGLSVPLTATGKAAPSTIYIYTTQPPQTCYEPFVVALNLMPNLVAVPAAVLLLESASKMSEFAHGQPQHPNYTSCIYASCVFGDFRPSHLTKAEKSATTQLRDWWLVFPRLDIQSHSWARECPKAERGVCISLFGVGERR